MSLFPLGDVSKRQGLFYSVLELLFSFQEPLALTGEICASPLLAYVQNVAVFQCLLVYSDSTYTTNNDGAMTIEYMWHYLPIEN